MTCKNCGFGRTEKIKLPEEFLYICCNCGYGRPIVQNPITYSDEYEKKYLSYPEEEISAIRLSLLPHDRNLSILDYGCGSGAFVRYARERGFQAYGFDVNDFTSDIRPPSKFKPDIVTAWDSFEHLTDAQQKIFFIRSRTAKYIAISLPDFSSAPQNESLYTWRHYRKDEHLHYYTAKALDIRMIHERFETILISHQEDEVRKAPWTNNILTMVFKRKGVE